MHYKFPKPVELKSKMKDLLEEKVDDKYYLSEKYLKCFSDMKNRNGFTRGERFNPRKIEECNTAFAITTRAGARPTDNFIIQKGHGFNKGRIKENIVPALTKSSWQENNFIVNINPSVKGMNGNVYRTNLSPTLTTNKGEGIKILHSDTCRIRKLTPLECWRLMGFRDMDYYAAKSVGISDAQLYKQAGNSIVVTVLEAIFRQLFLKKHRKKQGIIAEQIRIF